MKSLSSVFSRDRIIYLGYGLDYDWGYCFASQITFKYNIIMLAWITNGFIRGIFKMTLNLYRSRNSVLAHYET